MHRYMHDWRLRYDLMITVLNLSFGILSDYCWILRTWHVAAIKYCIATD